MFPEVQDEIVDSLFFHASDINQEVYNYAWKLHTEKQEKLKLRKCKEEAKHDGKLKKGHDKGSKSML